MNSASGKALGGNDQIPAGTGDDTVYAGTGDDTVNGQNGNDYLVGNLGDDTLNGQNGNDTIDTSGDDGVDIAHGGPQTDTCTADPAGHHDLLPLITPTARWEHPPGSGHRRDLSLVESLQMGQEVKRMRTGGGAMAPELPTVRAMNDW